jgi:hypothetical protein
MSDVRCNACDIVLPAGAQHDCALIQLAAVKDRLALAEEMIDLLLGHPSLAGWSQVLSLRGRAVAEAYAAHRSQCAEWPIQPDGTVYDSLPPSPTPPPQGAFYG